VAILVNCEYCGHSGRVADNLYGKTVKCPKCGEKVNVGTVAPPPLPASADAPVAAELIDDEGGGAYAMSSKCPDCGAQMASGAVLCVTCGFDVRTGSKHRRESPPPQPTYSGVRMSEPAQRERSSSSGDGEGGLGNIFWFIMIFGVGNAILYYYTGIVLIPIRR